MDYPLSWLEGKLQQLNEVNEKPWSIMKMIDQGFFAKIIRTFSIFGV